MDKFGGGGAFSGLGHEKEWLQLGREVGSDLHVDGVEERYLIIQIDGEIMLIKY